ncbi:hypothetical protein HMPREF0185_00606 [Brevundimonas diminuta 470-4]|nr:hypothetical protein HMPREF0185_00606 [Brevundimonas diminuta 470-4]
MRRRDDHDQHFGNRFRPFRSAARVRLCPRTTQAQTGPHPHS